MPDATPALKTDALSLVLNAGPVVQLVMLLLVVFSITSWAIIFMKWRVISNSRSSNMGFLKLFWDGKNFDEIYEKSENMSSSQISQVFRAGFKELKKLMASGSLEASSLDNIFRSLKRAQVREIEKLETLVSFLATVGSASPFIGLFGTVWGIMNSFQQIGATGSANLAVVAPGISEALIATAIGLFAAIPAVMFYNVFVNKIKRVGMDMDAFTNDFLNIVKRNTMKRS